MGSVKPVLTKTIPVAGAVAVTAFRLFVRLVTVLTDFAAQRPRIAGVVAVVALLLIVGANFAQARREAARRAEATAAAAASNDAMRKQAEAYKRYQDYEYVKRVGPITGPWYSNKW